MSAFLRLRQFGGRMLARYPLMTQSLQAGSLMAVGDVIAQTLVEGRLQDVQPPRSLELERVVRFFGIGLFVVGPGLKVWYGLLERFVGAGNAPRQVLAKVALDQMLFAPIFLANFLVLLGVLQGQRLEEIVRKLKSEYVDILFNNWKLWPAAQLVNFHLVPLQHRILFAQTVAVFWNTYLAYATNRSDPSSHEHVEILQQSRE